MIEDGDRDNHSVSSNVGETNDSRGSSPSSSQQQPSEHLVAGGNTAKFPSVHPLQLKNSGLPSTDNEGHVVHTSPIKRRASQAEELLKAEEAGGKWS